jgi:uncharacterized protein YciI
MSSVFFADFQPCLARAAKVLAAFNRSGLPSETMKNPARLLLAFLLIVLPPMSAQTPAANSGPAAAAPAIKTWFIRLIPPRPTFDKDMSEAETNQMKLHYVYWKDLFDKGVCVFGGPVLDPKGVYGVLAVRAASEDEAQAIAAGDPSVKAGINRIEVAEMRIAFLPKSN